VVRGPQCDYPAIPETYDAVLLYLAQRDVEASGPPRETFLTDHDAEEPLIEIAFALPGQSPIQSMAIKPAGRAASSDAD
jgi:hypothetical protein